MDETTFLRVSKDLIGRVRAALDACDPDVVECVPDADVVKIAFASGQPFVMNTQRPVREIRLAADRNAWHFRYGDGAWRDKRNNDEPLETVSRLVKARAGVDLSLSSPPMSGETP